MSYLEKLRATAAKGHAPAPTKPTEPGFDGFESAEPPSKTFAGLAEYRAALLLGRLVICANCSAFIPADDPYGLGRCSRYTEEAWPFVPFKCVGFDISERPLAPALLPDPNGARARALEPVQFIQKQREFREQL